MSELSPLIAEIEAEEVAEQGQVEALLFEYDRWRASESSNKQAKDEAGDTIKAWLNRHPGETLYDLEHNLKGYMQSKRGSRKLDLAAILEQDPSLLKQLIVTGCLKHDEKAVAKAGALAGGVDRYFTAYGEEFALQVVPLVDKR